MLQRRLVVRALLLPAMLTAAGVSACTVQRMQPPVTGQGTVVDDHMAHMTAEELRGPMAAPEAVIDMSQQGHEGLPASNNTSAARLKASPRHAEWVKIAWAPGSADSLMAWVVYPKTTAKAGVVVVVHEIFGLSSWVKGVADQVAADGFIAIAPDFLSKVRPGGPSTVELDGMTARNLIAGVDIPQRNLGIVAAANYAMMQPSATQKYAVIGYCWGGTTTFAHAVHGGVKGFSGGVPFYGSFPYAGPGTAATATTSAAPGMPLADSLRKISQPLMLLNGSNDTRIGATMPFLDSTMRALRKDYASMNYEGATHGFLREQDDQRAAGREGGPTAEATQAANMAASKDAWPKTIAFLKKQLK
jgi:carboxymethylenebutenolidase